MFNRQNPPKPSLRAVVATTAGQVGVAAETATATLVVVALVAVAALIVATAALCLAVTQ